jgi:hypothetical protein
MLTIVKPSSHEWQSPKKLLHSKYDQIKASKEYLYLCTGNVMQRQLFSLSLIALLTISFTVSTNAALMLPTKSIEGLDLRWGQTESNSIQAFNEAQNTYINTETINVDYLVGQNLFIGQKFTGLTHSSSKLYLSEGIYSSHLLHFDPLNNHSGNTHKQRYEFTDTIVAIILGGEYLNLSDYLLGNTNTLYEKSISRRMETHDLFILENTNTLLVDRVSVGRYWIDDARIITQSVPEPSAWAIFAIGLLSLFGARKLTKY